MHRINRWSISYLRGFEAFGNAAAKRRAVAMIGRCGDPRLSFLSWPCLFSMENSSLPFALDDCDILRHPATNAISFS